MNEFGRLFRYVRPHLFLLGLSLLLLALAGLFEVLTTALAIPLFDDVLIPADNQRTTSKLGLFLHYFRMIPGGDVMRLAVALLGLTILKGLSLYYSNYWMSRVGQHVVMDLRNELYGHVLSQSAAFFVLNSTGRLISRMSSDVDQVQEAVSTSLAELFRETVLLAALVLWVFYIDWKLAILAMGIAPAAFLLTLTMGGRIRRVSLKSREEVAGLSDQLQQSITGMRVVKAFGMEQHESRKFRNAAKGLFRTNLKAARILFLNSPIMELLGVVCFVPLLWYAHGRIVDGTLTVGFFGGSLFSLFRMYDPIRKLSRLHIHFQRAFASASRIMELLDTHVEILDRPGAGILDAVRGSVEFRSVHFHYLTSSGRTRVLHDINLAVRRNQVLALVGSSGSGKSTLVSLIPRFYDVSSGAVLIDGADIREFTQDSLRRQIAIVSQDTFLFNDTIRNNIAYGDIQASAERVEQAAKAALAHDFIMSLPMKYDTVIGERGQRLSGGERQRISIARAVLKNSPILILDEATSALDSESEQLVQEALSNLMQDRTTFVIAHRLSTIRNADRIVVLDQGRIAETGTHESLMEENGLYSRFWRLQAQEPAPQGEEGSPSPADFTNSMREAGG
jgi:subfamily B ATP-binding cassette protein MsbA